MSEPAPPATAPVSPQAEARALFDRAMERQRAGDTDAAVEIYCDLLQRYPVVADAYNNLAIILKSRHRVPAAIACLKRALRFAPQGVAVNSNLGNLLWMALEFDGAMAAYRRALAIDPTLPAVHHNLGLLHFSLGAFAEAVQCYDHALALEPSNRLVQWDRALALLAGGDLARGFAAYDLRFDIADPSLGSDPKLRAVRSRTLPLWQGEAPAGRTIHVYAEQGLGDTIQFARFLPLAADAGARIVFDCQAELMRLMAGFPGIAELRQEGAPPPPADFHLPLLSLPHRLGVTLATTAPRMPYLAAPATGPSLVRPPGTRLAIGIVWAGRAQHTNDHNRSIALEEFLALADLPGVALYGLQKGPRGGDIEALGARALIRDLAPLVQDFADTARLVMQLDLVIAVDTAIVHLAGALGKPCFVLLPYTPDWRWMGRREETPWYPSLRLFPQREPRDWKGVMARVRDALARTLGVAP
jgi:Tfp pilus assembly protein PilF